MKILAIPGKSGNKDFDLFSENLPLFVEFLLAQSNNLRKIWTAEGKPEKWCVTQLVIKVRR